MIDYMMAELYKAARRRGYLFGFFGTVFGGIILLFFLLKEAAGSAVNTFDSVAGVLGMFLSTGLYLVIVICDIVFSDQYKYNTLKNEVSFGLPRARIYLGKLLTAVIASFFACALILIFYLLLGRVLFPEETPVAELLNALGKALAAALPLWLGALGFFLMLQFVTKGSTAASVIYVLVVAVLPNILTMMELFLPKLRPLCEGIQECLLSNGFPNAITGSGAASDLSRNWLVGTAWFVLSTAAGLTVFQKREIS